MRPRTSRLEPHLNVMPMAEVDVAVVDMRRAAQTPTLDGEGFALVEHHTKVVDFHDPDAARLVYRPEIEQLVREITGCSHVFTDPHLVLRSERHPAHAPGLISDTPATLVHSDYTPTSVLTGLAAAMHDRGCDQRPKGRLVAYTVWRALTPPPQDCPLAVCDRRTVDRADMVIADAFNNVGSHVGEDEFYTILFNPNHRWGFFPDMGRGEALVFQQYDSMAQGAVACPHTAFTNPRAPKSATPRQSVEVRAFAFFS